MSGPESLQPDGKEFRPYFPEDLQQRVRDELGEAWLPVTERIAYFTNVYLGPDSDKIIPKDELNEARSLLPWVSHPFLNPLMRETDPSRLDELMESCETEVAKTHDALTLWRELGLDPDPLFYED